MHGIRTMRCNSNQWLRDNHPLKEIGGSTVFVPFHFSTGLMHVFSQFCFVAVLHSACFLSVFVFMHCCRVGVIATAGLRVLTGPGIRLWSAAGMGRNWRRGQADVCLALLSPNALRFSCPESAPLSPSWLWRETAQIGNYVHKHSTFLFSL